jgi:PIN domain nuclease of toxin-antitoxin system
MILLDTCALLWWTLEPERLSPAATDACRSVGVDGIIVSSISIWEIGIKVRKGALNIPVTLSDYVERLKKIDGLELVPVDETIWLKNIELEWGHRDPADRTIVATAMLRDTAIITKDRIIHSYYPSTIW